jgi:hypothetical protein
MSERSYQPSQSYSLLCERQEVRPRSNCPPNYPPSEVFLLPKLKFYTKYSLCNQGVREEALLHTQEVKWKIRIAGTGIEKVQIDREPIVQWTVGRGRDDDYSSPPARTRASATNAHGSYLGYFASKRTLG